MLGVLQLIEASLDTIPKMNRNNIFVSKIDFNEINMLIQSKIQYFPFNSSLSSDGAASVVDAMATKTTASKMANNLKFMLFLIADNFE